MNELAQAQALAHALIFSGPIIVCTLWIAFKVHEIRQGIDR